VLLKLSVTEMLVLQWHGIYIKFHEGKSSNVYSTDGQVDKYTQLTNMLCEYKKYKY
jgi:hypothetical protein